MKLKTVLDILPKASTIEVVADFESKESIVRKSLYCGRVDELLNLNIKFRNKDVKDMNVGLVSPVLALYSIVNIRKNFKFNCDPDDILKDLIIEK